jgi:hypothetical protein
MVAWLLQARERLRRVYSEVEDSAAGGGGGGGASNRYQLALVADSGFAGSALSGAAALPLVELQQALEDAAERCDDAAAAAAAAGPGGGAVRADKLPAW